MVQNKKDIYKRALKLLKKPLYDVWASLASESELDFILINDTKKLVKMIINKAPNEGIKVKFERLLDALRHPRKKGNVISDIINEFY